jgi:hypothetical protein
MRATARASPATVALAAAALATAVVAAPAAAADGWAGRLTAQAWAPSLDAQVDIRARRAAETDAEVFDDLQAVPSVEAELRRGRVALLAEWTRLDVDEDATVAAGRVPATVDLDGTLATFLASWRFAAGARWSAEALAGGRYVALDAEVAADARGPRRADTTQTWGDPLVGLRGGWALSERLTLTGRANVGGFGVGSDVTWEVAGRLGLRVVDHLTLAAGYRHLAVEYDDGDAAIDFALTGPFLALDLTF